MTPAFDPAAGLVFVGTGNPAPGDVDLVRPGDNLYANGVAALDAKTGVLRWFFQQAPHGQYDATGQAVLLDAKVGGRTVPAALECGKVGWCFVIDRASGKFLFRTDEVVPLCREELKHVGDTRRHPGRSRWAVGWRPWRLRRMGGLPYRRPSRRPGPRRIQARTVAGRR